MAVLYRQFHPSAPLQASVERLWLLEGPAAEIDAEPIPPDGRPEIIVHGGDPCAQIGPDGVLRPQALVLLAGQLTRPVRIVPRGFARIAGAHLRPHGAYDFLRVAQSQFIDRVVDLDKVDRSFARTLRTEVARLADGEQMVAALERVLSGRLGAMNDRPRRSLAAEAVAIALSMRGIIAVADLAHASGVGARQLERAFRERVGIPPKLFLRILRFQEALRAARTPGRGEGWAAIAVEHGFYDQAHFINDFKAFVGRTPGEWNIRDDSMAAIFSAVRRTPA